MDHNPVALQRGMVTSDEPGLYLAGKYGIRHENLILTVADGESQFGDFYSFETLTMFPFDRNGINPALLTAKQLDWLNEYHKTVYEKLSPLLNEEEREWLKRKTEPIKINHKTMPIILPLRGFTPQIGHECFIADNASIIGDVIIGDQCSIWFNTVLRGDVNSIRIGNRVNVQDGSVLHTLYQKSTIEIGDDVSIGHNVTIHGAKIKDGALIGMGAVVMDDVVVGEGAIVAAGSVVLSKTVIEPGALYGGCPAKFIKKVDPEQSQEINQKIAKNYLFYSKWYSEDNEEQK